MSRNSALEFLAFLNCWWGSSKHKFDSQISFSSKLHSLYLIADWVLILKELKILTDIWVTLRGFEGFSLGAGKKEIPGKRKIYIAVICWVIYYVAIVDKGLWIDLYIFKRLLSVCEDRFAILRTPITPEAFLFSWKHHQMSHLRSDRFNLVSSPRLCTLSDTGFIT